MFNIHVLIDDAKCFQTVRDMRWPDGVCCPRCNSKTVICFGKDDTQKERQRYQCHACNKRFDGDRICWPPSAASHLDYVSLSHGAKPFEPADRQRTGSQS